MGRLSIKTAFSCARTEFCKWLISQRMIIAAMLFVFVYLFAVQPLAANAEIMGEPLNILEPYIAALNSGSLLLIIPLGFFALSSDFPRTDGNMMFEMIRTGSFDCETIRRTIVKVDDSTVQEYLNFCLQQEDL